MEKTFDNFKNYIIEAGKSNNACKDEFNRVLTSDNFTQLFDVIKNNFHWCFQYKKILNSEILLQYVELAYLNNEGFYVNQKINTLKSN